MPNEIELKFKLQPNQIEAFLALTELAVAPLTIKQLYSIYYDTADGHLAKNDYVLRVRKKDHSFVQTVKRSGTVTAGLHQRPEWEWPVATIEPELNCFPDPSFLKNVTLVPLFVTEYQRHSWLVKFKNSTIEVCLDQGKIYKPKFSKNILILEVELELLQGTNAELIEFGTILQQKLELEPENINKAEKGFKLINELLIKH